jgi:hypothetical protein
VTRKSPYVLELTGEQRRELEARARRYTSPYREVVRAKIVLMAARGLDNDEIAARLDTNRVIVSSGENASSNRAFPASRSVPAAVALEPFPPEVVVAVKSLACELPSRLGVPLSRLFVPDI